MDATKQKMVRVRSFTEDFLEGLRKMTPAKLESKFRIGDYLLIGEACFKMVHYSMTSISDGNYQSRSRYVTYWSPLFDLEINLDFAEQTVTIEPPITDWDAMGF